MRVLVIDPIAPEGLSYLEERGVAVDQVSSRLGTNALHGRIADDEAINVPPDVMEVSKAVAADFARLIPITP